MQETDLARLTAQLLWAGLGLGVVFGAVAQRSHFCTMGAVSDIVNMGDWSRMRMWAIAVAVALIGFNGMVAVGWVEASKTIYAAPRLLWLSHLVGGLSFGFGMVLASGCGSKTLVRVGGGNLKSVVVLCVLGIAAFASLKGITAVGRVATVDSVAWTLPAGQDLPSLLAHAGLGSRATLALVCGVGGGLGLMTWAMSHRDGRSGETLLGGLGVGAVIAAAWWLSGRVGHLTEHPLTLDEVFLATNSQRMESLSFVAPIAYTMDWVILFSDKSKLLTLGIVTTVGVVLGSALTALATGSFRWEGFAGVEDTANHLVGAAMMGVGGVTALGCTVGQGLSGLSTLALGSVLAVAGIMAGAVFGVRWQVYRLNQSA